MKQTPILFKAKMVRAILEGRKTMTRRIVKNLIPPQYTKAKEYEPNRFVITPDYENGGQYTLPPCKYGVPGDWLWVKETFAYSPTAYVYKASFKEPDAQEVIDLDTGETIPLIWKSPLFMSRDGSRITLEIVKVRVERVQDISDTDVLAEGLSPDSTGTEILTAEDYKLSPLRYKFACLWESITGRDGWNDNPWVWVIEFKKITP